MGVWYYFVCFFKRVFDRFRGGRLGRGRDGRVSCVCSALSFVLYVYFLDVNIEVFVVLKFSCFLGLRFISRGNVGGVVGVFGIVSLLDIFVFICVRFFINSTAVILR